MIIYLDEIEQEYASTNRKRQTTIFEFESLPLSATIARQSRGSFKKNDIPAWAGYAGQ